MTLPRKSMVEFKLVRAQITERRMPSTAVVKALNVEKNIRFGFGSSTITTMVGQFRFEGAEETFHSGIPSIDRRGSYWADNGNRARLIDITHWYIGGLNRNDATGRVTADVALEPQALPRRPRSQHLFDICRNEGAGFPAFGVAGQELIVIGLGVADMSDDGQTNDLKLWVTPIGRPVPRPPAG